MSEKDFVRGKIARSKEMKNRSVCDAPCPVCGHRDLHCLTYACGIVSLECPKCEAKGTGCSIGGAYSNMKTLNRKYDDKDTRAKAALESIAASLEIIAGNFTTTEA